VTAIDALARQNLVEPRGRVRSNVAAAGPWTSPPDVRAGFADPS